MKGDLVWEQGRIYRHKESGAVLLYVGRTERFKSSVWLWLTRHSMNSTLESSFHITTTDAKGKLPFDKTTDPKEWRLDFDEMGNLGEVVMTSLEGL